MIPYLEDSDFTLYHGDALETLRELPDESVHMCVTSPPFYGLRDYGTGSWEGGDEGCDHIQTVQRPSAKSTLEDHGDNGRSPSLDALPGIPFRDVCGKCGARRVDRQIGLESTPDEWVAALVGVFREVRRVLRSDGTLWVEVGDSYAGSPGGSGGWDGNNKNPDGTARTSRHASGRWANKPAGYKPKDLIGAPWLLAFALRADGWYLRSDVVWARPNPMPESVRDRPTKSHSYVFLLSKSARYFFDQEAVREPPTSNGGGANFYAERGREWSRTKKSDDTSDGGTGRGLDSALTNPAGRNARSVWTIPTEPLPDEHYAAFPQKLVERCILAGSSERGVCPECGAPWQRQVETSYVAGGTGGGGGRKGDTKTAERAGLPVTMPERKTRQDLTVGWQPACQCGERVQEGVTLLPEHPSPVPSVVLDPFMGSGTTALVARRLGRRAIGVELSESYCAMAARRTRQLSLFGGPGDESYALEEAANVAGKNERHIDHRKHGFNERWKAGETYSLIPSPNEEKES